MSFNDSRNKKKLEARKMDVKYAKHSFSIVCRQDQVYEQREKERTRKRDMINRSSTLSERKEKETKINFHVHFKFLALPLCGVMNMYFIFPIFLHIKKL